MTNEAPALSWPFLRPIVMQLPSVPGRVGPSGWSVHKTQHRGIGPGVCQKDGGCLERIQTLKQQVFRISPKEMCLGMVNLKTGGGEQSVNKNRFSFVYLFQK